MKQTLKQKLDDVFEDMNSYTGVKLAEDELFDRVLELFHSHTQEVVEKIKGMKVKRKSFESYVDRYGNEITLTEGGCYNQALDDVLALLKEDNNK